MKLKKLQSFNKSTGGRNSSGKITVRHIGGRFKRKLRLIDMRRRLFNQVGLVIRKDFDPNRNCILALLYFEKFGFFSYILASEGLNLYDKVFFYRIPEREKKNVRYKKNFGSSFRLKDLPINTKVYNVELKPSFGGQLARSAGAYSRIMKQYVTRKGFVLTGLEMPSDKFCYVDGNCIASLGIVSNKKIKFKKFQTAGRSRRLGIRPTVRGVAMNPVDHPHGGGEGKTSGGRVSVSPWGLLTKGYRTRKRLKVNKLKFFIKRINKSKV